MDRVAAMSLPRLGLAAFACVVLCSAPALAEDPVPPPSAEPSPRRGPIESNEEWVLVQNRLTLPPISPDPLGRSQTRLRLDFDWGNDFGWSQNVKGENPADRRFLVDAEHRTLALDVRRGISERVSVGLRVPLQWRGGGMLDGIIDAFHRAVTRPLGLPDSGRPFFRQDLFRVLGRDAEFRPVGWGGKAGTGLGNVEASFWWAAQQPADPDRWTGALVARLGLPTGAGPFRAHGVQAGLQYAVARRLSRRIDAYLGLGMVGFSDDEAEGIRYASARLHGFVALEWRAARRFSLLLQTDGSSRLVTNLAAYPAMQSYLKIASKIDLSGRLTLEAGFTENLVSQAATTDFGIFLGLARRF